MKLKINEIYHSIQGESTYVGTPCVFVRLTYCNLRCTYCDTEYAFYDGKEMSIEEILSEIKSFLILKYLPVFLDDKEECTVIPCKYLCPSFVTPTT